MKIIYEKVYKKNNVKIEMETCKLSNFLPLKFRAGEDYKQVKVEDVLSNNTELFECYTLTTKYANGDELRYKNGRKPCAKYKHTCPGFVSRGSRLGYLTNGEVVEEGCRKKRIFERQSNTRRGFQTKGGRAGRADWESPDDVDQTTDDEYVDSDKEPQLEDPEDVSVRLPSEAELHEYMMVPLQDVTLNDDVGQFPPLGDM